MSALVLRPFVAFAAAIALVVVVVDGCKQTGCTSDTDCKGSRVCQSGACVEPATPSSSSSPTTTATTFVAPIASAPVTQELVGDYLCSIDTYPAMRCRIAREPSGVLTLDKLEGSQRFHGVILPNASGFSFNGAYSCPEGGGNGSCSGGTGPDPTTCAFTGFAGNFSCKFSPGGERVLLVRSGRASAAAVDACPNGRCPCSEKYSQPCPGVVDDGIPSVPHGPFCCLPTMFCGAYACEDKSHMVPP